MVTNRDEEKEGSVNAFIENILWEFYRVKISNELFDDGCIE